MDDDIDEIKRKIDEKRENLNEDITYLIKSVNSFESLLIKTKRQFYIGFGVVGVLMIVEYILLV